MAKLLYCRVNAVDSSRKMTNERIYRIWHSNLLHKWNKMSPHSCSPLLFLCNTVSLWALKWTLVSLREELHYSNWDVHSLLHLQFVKISKPAHVTDSHSLSLTSSCVWREGFNEINFPRDHQHVQYSFTNLCEILHLVKRVKGDLLCHGVSL